MSESNFKRYNSPYFANMHAEKIIHGRGQCQKFSATVAPIQVSALVASLKLEHNFNSMGQVSITSFMRFYK